ncbi:SMI1/KNR4 family protein [Rhodopirellula sp. P2]|uniref:SMI1/KNR4 family protein n=1 Tax=Rhodopirellula sp. P2 TaxID=2127060 RepID=UPI0023677FE1|nr:SMI1/KNR4 family protein [Rhodopirellula sp. P2]WDQ19138.1 SMI1/KNR4 family protein [Rhodopirellula sp. P2]
MDFDAFRQFVESNIDWFRGRLPETDATFTGYESALGCRFPASIRWLLTTHGYWHATGIPNLDESVTLTLQLRQSIALPNDFVILADHGDGGVIVLDSSSLTMGDEFTIHDVDAATLHGLDVKPFPPDIVYDSFGQYAKSVLESQRSIIDPPDVVYDPRAFGD